MTRCTVQLHSKCKVADTLGPIVKCNTLQQQYTHINDFWVKIKT